MTWQEIVERVVKRYPSARTLLESGSPHVSGREIAVTFTDADDYSKAMATRSIVQREIGDYPIYIPALWTDSEDDDLFNAAVAYLDGREIHDVHT